MTPTASLRRPTGNAPAESYEYDLNGNRQTTGGTTYATGPNNEMLVGAG